MQTGRARYSGNMNTLAFSCINFKLPSVKQTNLNTHRSTYKNKCYTRLVHIFLRNLI